MMSNFINFMDLTIWLPFVALAAVLTAAAVSDAQTGLIRNRLTYGATLVGLAGWAAWGLGTAGVAGASAAITPALLATLLGLGIGVTAFALGGLGGGDAKLMAAIGALSGNWRLTLAAIVYGVVIAAVMAVVVMVRHGLVRRTFFVLVGAAFQVSRGGRPSVPDDSPKVPFGVALAVGGVLAGLEHLLRVPVPWGLQ